MPQSQPPLWAGRDRATADHFWLAPEPPKAKPAPPPPPPPAPRRRLGRKAAAGAAALLLAGGFGAGALLDDDPSGAQNAQRRSAPLPAATGGGVGESRARAVYAATSDAVAQIRTGSGSGTGFLIDEQGTVVTNAHVVGTSQAVRVQLDEDDERGVAGDVVGVDESSDLAVVKVDRSAVAGIRPLAFANSDDVRVGDVAIAIGYPLGLQRTATSGIISGVGRQIQAPDGFSIDEVIQTDAPINPGNSGGPLLDSRGRVIGVNSQIATAGGGGGNVGIGFAVPANTAREIVPRLQAGETIRRPYIGVSTQATPGATGARGAQVTPGSPAARAGLEPGRDIIVGLGGDRVNSPEDLSAAVADRRPGERVELEIERDGMRERLTVELAERP